jgi:glycosyltransferase involved in cell wall biosynthesis
VPTVLHVTQPTDAGVARAVLDLVTAQAADGVRVAVASPGRESFTRAVTAAGAEHRPWRASRSPGPASLAESLRLGRILRDVGPELVHLHSSKAGLAGRLALRGSRTTIFQPHAWSFEAAQGLQRRAALAWERFGSRWTDAIICVSEAERRRGEEAGVRARYVVVPNGVDVQALREAGRQERASARERLGLVEGPLVVCVGRLSRQKGQDLLLRAWPSVVAQVPGARLALVGDGPERERLQALAPADVVFAGARDDVPDWLAAADVVAAPSRWEGMSLALLEALARGRTVVAADTPGSAEAIGQDAGAVVPVENIGALADAVVERLLDPARAKAEGHAARLRAERQHDLRRTVTGVAAVYRDLGFAKP